MIIIKAHQRQRGGGGDRETERKRDRESETDRGRDRQRQTEHRGERSERAAAHDDSRRPSDRLPPTSAAPAETLLKAQLGPVIDGHDFVIRINQAPATGNYGIDAGVRTGARFLNRKLTEVYAENGRSVAAAPACAVASILP